MDSLTCNNCNFTAKNLAGFKSHSRACKTKMPHKHQENSDSSCEDCDMLPFGGVQLTAIFLVLIFALISVFFLSLYNNNELNKENTELRQQLKQYEN